MKIIAIGRNYAEHAKELNNSVPSLPVIFLKPDTALLKDNKPFYYPDFSKDIHHEIEVVLKIGKEGKHIQEKFAGKYIEAISLGIDFTARDLQQQQKEKGLPWEIAKGFDGAAPVGAFFPVAGFLDFNDIHFHLDKNKTKVQEGHTANLLFSFAYIISYVSSFYTLKKGDLIFTGTPSGVGPVQIGDHLEGYLENKKVLDFYIK